MPSLEEIKNFVTQGYTNILKREPDPIGLENFINAISFGSISKELFIQILKNSEEYKNTLTICIITMNEIDNVKRTLESIEGIGNEIIAIDENSTNGTRELLNKYKVKIIDSKLDDNFGNLRNTAISNSTCHWILFIDSDETLDIPLKEVLLNRELLKHCERYKYDAVAFKRKNCLDNGIQMMQYYPDFQGRLFKNNGIIRYTGRVHELLIGYNNMLFSDFHLIHIRNGFNFTTEDIRKKRLKYDRLVGMR